MTTETYKMSTSIYDKVSTLSTLISSEFVPDINNKTVRVTIETENINENIIQRKNTNDGNDKDDDLNKMLKSRDSTEIMSNLDEVDHNIEEFCKIPGEPDLEYIHTSSNPSDIESNRAFLHTISDYMNNNNNNNDNESSTIKIKSEITLECSNVHASSNDGKQNDSRLKKCWKLLNRLKWSNIFYLSVLHITFVFACIHAATYPVKFWTAAGAVVVGFLSGMGMSVGAHRYWAHRSFKAHTFLRLALMLLQTMTMNGSIFSYARDHRNHHKYSDTEADPKNPARGLFHAHVGWWLWKKSQIVIMMGKKFDVSDLWNDKIIWFQHNFYIPLFLVFNILIPTIAPWLIWNENLLTSFYVMVVLRTTIVLHLLFCVNSVAHHYGYRPYDFRIRPADNRIINYLSLGEGNHNYHHVFPYDYRSNEKAYWEYFDPISVFIQINKFFGLAYDCKKASPRVIEGIIRRKGISAYFDQKRSMTFRLANAVFDWTAGSIVSLWFLYPFMIYKAMTGQEVFIFRLT